VRYRKKCRDDRADRELLRALAAERRQFGYRRLREMAKRKGRRMNLKKVYRLYREEAVRRRRGRKRATGGRAPLPEAQRRTRFGCSTSCRTCWRRAGASGCSTSRISSLARGFAAEGDTSLPGPWVARALDGIVAERGKPEMIVSDNGTELTCNAMLKWAEENGV
jgi:putative transposase